MLISARNGVGTLMARLFPRSALVRLAMIIVIAAGYYVTGRLGLLMAIPPGVATAVWPPSGIALAAVLLLGYDVWPGIWLGSFLVNSHILSGSDLPTTTALLVAGSIGLGSTLQALLSAVLIRRFIGVRNPFDRARDVFKFIGIVALSCVAAATFGVTSSYLSGLALGAVLEINWFTWYLGDLAGAIVVTPLLLTWSKWLEFRLRSRRILEAVLMLVLRAPRAAPGRRERRFGRKWQRYSGLFVLLKQKLDLPAERLRRVLQTTRDSFIRLVYHPVRTFV